MEEELASIFEALNKKVSLSERPEAHRMDYLSLGVKIMKIIERCTSLESLQKVKKYIDDNANSFNALHIDDTHWASGKVVYMDVAIRELLDKQIAVYSPHYRAPRMSIN